MKKYIHIIFLSLIPIIFSGCGINIAKFGFENNDVNIFAFNNIEVILLSVGLMISSFFYQVIVGPLALSFIGLLVLFKLIQMIIQGIKGEDISDNDLFNGKILVKTIFQIFALFLLLLHIPVGITIISSKSTGPENGTAFKNLKDDISSYKIQPPKNFNLSAKPEDYFGKNSIFSFKDTYRDKLIVNSMSEKVLENGNEFKVKLPLALIFPIVLADNLIYGSDAQGGIMNVLFPDTFPILVADPGKIFEILANNGSYEENKRVVKTKKYYDRIVIDKGKMISDLNNDFTNVIQNYYNTGYALYYTYLKQDEETLKNVNSTENYTRLKIIIEETDKYFKELYNYLVNKNGGFTKSSKSLYANMLEHQIATDPTFSTLLNDHRGYEEKYLIPNDSKIIDKPLHNIFKDVENYTVTFTPPAQPNSMLSAMSGKMTYYRLQFNGTPPPTYEKSSIIDEFKDIAKVDVNDENQVFVNPEYRPRIDQRIIFNFYDSYLKNNHSLGYTNMVNISNPYDALIKEEQNLEELLLCKDVNNSLKTELCTQNFFKDNNLQEQREIYYQNINNYMNIYFPDLTKSVNINSNYLNVVNGKPSYHSSIFMYNRLVKTKSDLDNILNKYIDNVAKRLISNLKNKDLEKMKSDIKNKKLNINIEKGINKSYKDIINTYSKNEALLRNDIKGLLIHKINKVWLRGTIIENGEEKKPQYEDNSLDDIMNNFPAPGGEDGGFFGFDIWNFVASLFKYIFQAILGMLKVGLTAIGYYLFTIIYSLHSLGIVLILIYFPLILISKVILREEYEELFNPFKNYVSYRMWDFALLVMLTLLSLAGPIIINFIKSMNFFVGTLMEIFFLFMIFKITGMLIKNITEIIGGKTDFVGFFEGTASTGKGITMGAAGLAGIGTIAGTAAAARTVGGGGFNVGKGVKQIAGKGIEAHKNGFNIVDKVSTHGKNLGKGISDTYDNIKSNSLGENIKGFGKGVGNVGKSVGNVGKNVVAQNLMDAAAVGSILSGNLNKENFNDLTGGKKGLSGISNALYKENGDLIASAKNELTGKGIKQESVEGTNIKSKPLSSTQSTNSTETNNTNNEGSSITEKKETIHKKSETDLGKNKETKGSTIMQGSNNKDLNSNIKNQVKEGTKEALKNEAPTLGQALGKAAKASGVNKIAEKVGMDLGGKNSTNSKFKNEPQNNSQGISSDNANESKINKQNMNNMDKVSKNLENKLNKVINDLKLKPSPQKLKEIDNIMKEIKHGLKDAVEPVKSLNNEETKRHFREISKKYEQINKELKDIKLSE